MGDQELYRSAKPITEFDTPELHQLIAILFETMQTTGGVGIAATQIGVPLQVTVFGFDKSERYPHAQAVPATILINPNIEPLSEAINEDWEGCLSIRGLRGLVPRYTKIRYSGYDEKGNFFSREVEGFHARLVQHEVDHLQGKIFPFRIKDLRYFGFEENIKKLQQALGSKLK
jgi:peptide deformylase